MGWLRKKKKKKPKSDVVSESGAQLLEDLIECCDGKSNPIKFFSANEIRKATNNFSYSNFVHELAYYYVWYSGKNENHPMILIKKSGELGEDLLCRDIAVSSMVSGHKNFLKLVGCCLESEDPAMVYNGVKKHYQLEISEQPWKRRMKIAEDIATALAYLHTAFPRPFVYRSLSLRKILLDEDGVAKLNDFSYCVSIPEGETFVKVDEKAHGFYSYLDDNYKSGGVVSEKTDVFAFGMFMGLTLLLGNRSIEEEEEESQGGGSNTDYDFDSMRKRLAQNVMSKLKEDRRMEEIADPKMIEKMGQISEQELCQMEAFRILSLRCIGPREEVPTMVEVAKELKKIQTSLYNDSSSP
ncbi:Serine-threonine/tyrosine-protein kinase catalytic domain [Arabidopsis suecica]|uniref:Serine-threonine/tyrosine-protein kinase catalytic domain n=1 Tax=Arabidopsis suecica TaxID=45249 RepID=A0A8T2BQZ9_ARASU|nr:Serine-threonine/tyrosine-protein kinase catalytic domain [Arabidopsis suecica]